MHVLVEMGMKLAQVEYVVFDEADRYVSMYLLRNIDTHIQTKF